MFSVEDQIKKMDWGKADRRTFTITVSHLMSRSIAAVGRRMGSDYVTFRDMGAAFAVAILGSTCWSSPNSAHSGCRS